MKRIFVLVGPPGVGKSSLVELAKSRGIYAIDIEKVHDDAKASISPGQDLTSIMDQKIIELLDTAPDGISIFGAGGYGSHFPAERIEKILLLPPKSDALDRFTIRDQGNVEKQNQKQDFDRIYNGFYYFWKSGERKYDFVLDQNLSIEQTLDQILNL